MIGAALLVIMTCERTPHTAGVVLARVGDRVITEEDFMRRAEYTMRPDYCAGDNYIHRKIVLNSLIAEKLLALETPQSPLLKKPEFKAYIQGRQEQAMRQWLFKTKGRDLVSVDTSETRQALRQAIRSYAVQYVNLPDSNAANGWNRARSDGYSFDILASTLVGSDTIPTHELDWFERGDEPLHGVVFGQSHQQGDILGPLALEDGSYVVIRIKGWVDRPVITESELAQQYADVRERLFQSKADAEYKQFVAGIMAGHRLELNPPIFKAYALKAAELYLKANEEKEQLLNQAIWNSEEQILTQSLSGSPDIAGDAVLFSIDGRSWTMDRFEAELQRHPLVFRQRKISHKEFPEQLKYAIADLIRDHYLTETAYGLGYDQVPNIRQYVQTWQDHYVSRKARNDYLQLRLAAEQDSVDQSELGLLTRYMDPLINSLQAKYADQIIIDTDLFESLELSSIPMMVSNRNLPFPISVPAFPRLTTDDRVDYGRRLGD